MDLNDGLFFSNMKKNVQKLRLGPAYNEFGYNENPVTASRFFYIELIDCNVKRFTYNEHPIITSSFFTSFSCCKRDPVYFYNFHV